MDDHETLPLGAALHDRVRDEHPDLEDLLRRASRDGARLRRRRRGGLTLAVVSGVAVLAVTAGLVTSGPDHTSDGTGFAADPTSRPSPAPPDGPKVLPAESEAAGDANSTHDPQDGPVVQAPEVVFNLAEVQRLLDLSRDPGSAPPPGDGDVQRLRTLIDATRRVEEASPDRERRLAAFERLLETWLRTEPTPPG